MSDTDDLTIAGGPTVEIRGATIDPGDRVRLTYRPFWGGDGGGAPDVPRTTTGTVVETGGATSLAWVAEDDTEREFEISNSGRLVVHYDGDVFRDDAIGDDTRVEVLAKGGREYHAAVSAFGNVRVRAPDEAAAIERLNAALAALDTGDLGALTVDYVDAPDDERWEQREARDRGIEEP